MSVVIDVSERDVLLRVIDLARRSHKCDVAGCPEEWDLRQARLIVDGLYGPSDEGRA